MPTHFSPAELAGFIEHTGIQPDATVRDIEQLCAEAREHHFYAVCVNGGRVEFARHLLAETPVKIVASVGFPFGAMSSDVKRYET